MKTEVLEQSNQPKITMSFLYKRNNRNKHFQVIKNDGLLGLNKVYTGLGLYKAIHECALLSLQKYPKEFRDEPKNRDFLLNEQMNFQAELCTHVIIGKNKDAQKNSFGDVVVHSGELESL